MTKSENTGVYKRFYKEVNILLEGYISGNISDSANCNQQEIKEINDEISILACIVLFMKEEDILTADRNTIFDILVKTKKEKYNH